jgi:hypothetical protein
MPDYTTEERRKIRDLATRLYAHDDDIEFDLLLPGDLSVTTDGVWVHGWLWVTAEECELAGIELKG